MDEYDDDYEGDGYEIEYRDDYDTTLEDALSLCSQYAQELEREIAELKADNTRWTYCEDEMPPEKEEVLVTITGMRRTTVAQYAGGGRWKYAGSRILNEVIAWSPLPQPAPVRQKEAQS